MNFAPQEIIKGLNHEIHMLKIGLEKTSKDLLIEQDRVKVAGEIMADMRSTLENAVSRNVKQAEQLKELQVHNERQRLFIEKLKAEGSDA